MALDGFLGETFSKSSSPGSENEAKRGKKHCFVHVGPGGTSSDGDWEAQQCKLLQLPAL